MSHTDNGLLPVIVLIWLHGVIMIVLFDKRTNQILKAIQDAKKGDQL